MYRMFTPASNSTAADHLFQELLSSKGESGMNRINPYKAIPNKHVRQAHMREEELNAYEIVKYHDNHIDAQMGKIMILLQTIGPLRPRDWRYQEWDDRIEEIRYGISIFRTQDLSALRSTEHGWTEQISWHRTCSLRAYNRKLQTISGKLQLLWAELEEVLDSVVMQSENAHAA